jgi:hypothetical protein
MNCALDLPMCIANLELGDDFLDAGHCHDDTHCFAPAGQRDRGELGALSGRRALRHSSAARGASWLCRSRSLAL